MSERREASRNETALAAELFRVRQELARSEHRFRSAFGNQFQFMAILSPEGHVLDFNRQLAPGVALRRDEVIGLPFWKTPSFASLPGAEQMWKSRLSVAAASSTPVLSEDAFTSSTGELRHATAAVHAVRDESGTLDCFIVQAADITERKQAEALRDSMEAQLRQSQKMQAIGTLAGGIAHDFNNILGVILANVAIASEALGANHEAEKQLQQIRTAGQRARHLVQQILTFSRQHPHELVSQPLRPVVDETMGLLRTILPAGVDLAAQPVDRSAWLRCDATQIQQVLMNLCTNAWHALRNGMGRVEVGAEAMSDGRLHLWVADDGIGMDPCTQQRIFEPFFTTKPANVGTGLGLSVVHGIVMSHGGSVEVQSAAGVGSVFHVFLPCVPQQDVQPSEVTVALTQLAGNGKHVLLLDDDETIAVLAAHLLVRAGHRVTTFGDPTQALAAIQQSAGDFDALVTDFNMPGQTGLEVILRARRYAPGLPVVLSSGYFGKDLYAAAERMGLHFLLRKENLLEDLCRLVSQAIEAGGHGARAQDGTTRSVS